MLTIRPTTAGDEALIWSMIEPIMREGETFCLDRNGDRAQALDYWSGGGRTNFIAEADGSASGSSYIRPNQLGAGRHVANCGYMTAPAARGRGVARALCAHSIEWCRNEGFAAIQFNFVVSTNEPAVHLWTSFGFRTLGRLPGAFAHPRLGFVDALVMWKDL